MQPAASIEMDRATKRKKSVVSRHAADATVEKLETRLLFNGGAYQFTIATATESGSTISVPFAQGISPVMLSGGSELQLLNGTNSNGVSGAMDGSVYIASVPVSLVAADAAPELAAVAYFITGGQAIDPGGSGAVAGTYTWGSTSRIQALYAQYTGDQGANLPDPGDPSPPPAAGHASGASTEPPLSSIVGSGPVIAFEDGTDWDLNDDYIRLGVSAPSNGSESNQSSNPIGYINGNVATSQTDLSSSGFGGNFSVTRSWTNGLDGSLVSDNVGNNWLMSQTPTLLQAGASLQVLQSGSKSAWFDSNGSGGYTGDFGATDTIAAVGTTQFNWTDPSGNVTEFYSFDSSIPTALQGKFKEYIGAGGQTVQPTYNGSNQLVQLALTSPITSDSETFTYSYISTGVNAGKISSIAQQRNIDSGPVRTVTYTYYDGTTSNGNAGDLETAVVTDGSSNVLSTNYYRYYTPTTPSAAGTGYTGGLQYYFDDADYRRLAAAVGTPLTATDADVASYASNFYQYDASQKVIQETYQGGGTAGLGTSTYAYTNSSNPWGYNSWATKTIETLPNGDTNTVYSNGAGEQMLKVYTSAATGQEWGYFTAYDDNGKPILSAQPSAVALPASLSTLEQYADLLNQTGTSSAGYPEYEYLNASAGLLNLTDYYTATTATTITPGGAVTYAEDTKVEDGDSGTPILESNTDYFAHNAAGATVYPTADSTQYNTAGTGAETTSYRYTWFSSSSQMQSQATTLPTGTMSTNVYNQDDQVIWSKDAAGNITYNAYDPTTGALIETISDVDTSNTGDFDASTLPSGWTTPTGGGANSETTYGVDALGRVTKTTNPAGNVTFTIYDDPDQEVRTYPGWHQDPTSGLWTTTGPVQVTRADSAGSYSETLTYTYTPVSGTTVPTGTDAIANLQSLNRTILNSAGQTTEKDAYLDLTGVTYSTSSAHLGTAGINYYPTYYGYDINGNQDRVEDHTGAITRTVYNGQDEPISTWVGTDDTPSSGTWSPTNNTAPSNMVETSASVYDNGGVGDGNVTESVQTPGGVSPLITETFYNWRDQQVSQEEGLSSSTVSLPYNLQGIVADGSTYSSSAGDDGYGNALPASVLGTTQSWNDVPYALGAAGANNVVRAAGQTIPLPAGSFSTLSFVGFAVNGSQADQSFTVTYTDGSTQAFTQSMSDWVIMQNFAGQSLAATTPYVDTYAGTEYDAATAHLYGYNFALDPSKTVQSVTLPNNSDVIVTAMNVFGQPAPVYTPTPVALGYNQQGIYADGSTFSSSGGLDGYGTAFSANSQGTSRTWNGGTYTIGAAGGNNVVDASGQTISLPFGNYSTLSLLAAATPGAQTGQSFVIHYSDGTTQTITQSFSDWATAQNFPGESVAVTSPHSDRYDGSEGGSVHVYGYTFNLDPDKIVTGITLPNDGAVRIFAIDTAGRPQTLTSATQVSLSFNQQGIYSDGATFASSAGIDGGGTALSANLLGTSQTWNGQTFGIGAAGANNVVSAAGQTIALPTGSYAELSFLGTGVDGNQPSQTFTVTYTDDSTQTFTQSMSDWYTSQGYAGESVATSLAYRDLNNGTQQTLSNPFHVYGYSFELNPDKTVASITLPNNSDIKVLAIDVAAAAP
jgi:hypothetical protein